MYSVHFVFSNEFSVFDRDSIGLQDLVNQDNTLSNRLVVSFYFNEPNEFFRKENSNKVAFEHGYNFETNKDVYEWLKNNHYKGTWEPLAVGGNYQWKSYTTHWDDVEGLILSVKTKRYSNV